MYDPEGLVAAYTYDGDGNRVLELSYDTELKGNLNNKDFTTVNAAEAALTEYLGDEERALYEITRYINDVNREYTEVLMERDGSGALATAYVYGNERLSVRSTKKENGYYLYDGRGSLTNIVSILGERLESYSYDPAGRVMRATSTNRYQKTFYGYNAEGYDPKTGSVYLRARYYNTHTGSFNTKDTYLGNLMDPLSRNRYAYAQGNPVNYNDPSGHSMAGVYDFARGISFSTGTPWDAVIYGILTGLYLFGKCVGVEDTVSANSDYDWDYWKKTLPRYYPADSKAIPRVKDDTIAITGDKNYVIIFRWYKVTYPNHTPKEKDRWDGMSYSLLPPNDNYTVTSDKLIDTIGALNVILDRPPFTNNGQDLSHVSVVTGEPLWPEWIASQPTARQNPHELTVAILALSVSKEGLPALPLAEAEAIRNKNK